MQSPAPQLLPLLRSALQGEVLALILLNPEQEWSLTELANRVGASVSTAQREVSRAEDAGVVVSRRVGNTRLVRALPSPITQPLPELLLRIVFSLIRLWSYSPPVAAAAAAAAPGSAAAMVAVLPTVLETDEFGISATDSTGHAVTSKETEAIAVSSVAEATSATLEGNEQAGITTISESVSVSVNANTL